MSEDGALAIALVAAGLLIPLVGWLGKIVCDRIFDDPLTRGFFDPVAGKYFGATIFGLWFLLGAGTFPLAFRNDFFHQWVVATVAAIPVFFIGFFLARGLPAHRLAKSWRQVAGKFDLEPDIDPDTTYPRMRGNYRGRSLTLNIEEEADDHITVVTVELAEASKGIEIASSQSLYFRPYEGLPIGFDEPGALEFRLYGADDDVASLLNSEEFLQHLTVLEYQCDELRIGPEKISTRQNGGTLGTTELTYFAMTLTEIADMIDEANTASQSNPSCEWSMGHPRTT